MEKIKTNEKRKTNKRKQKAENHEVSPKGSCSIFVFEVNYEFLSESFNSEY